jgi:hypothetical protein
MANINVKEILKKLSFFKNNLSLLAAIFIAAVALLLFVPTRILGSKLRKTMEQSAAVGRTIKSQASQLEDAAAARQMEPYINAYTRDVNQIENLTKQTTLRELLSYRLFPDTNESTTLLYEEFGRHYRSGVDAMLQSVGAGLPPTDADINAALQRAPQMGLGAYGGAYGGYAPGGLGRGAMPSFNLSKQSSGSVYGDYGPGMGMPSMMLTDTQRKILDTICLEKAQALGVYASPVEIAGYLYWTDWKFDDRDAAYKDCWYWQMGYWMIEDVFTTVREMNKGSSGVVDAPVKRIMNVSFVLGRTTGRAFRRPGRGVRVRKEGENPLYVTSAKDGMTVPCTGRFTCEDYDVMQFNVRTIVDAKSTLPFMKQLCTAKPHKFRGWNGHEPEQTYLHNQITVLESSIAPVDPERFDHMIYRYGDAQVVELDLICEYIFNKAAYEAIKPKQVKDDITTAIESATKGKRR